MASLIAAIVGFFSTSANNRKAQHYYTMQEYQDAIDSNVRKAKTYQALEIIVPMLIIAAILYFYFKIAKKWL